MKLTTMTTTALLMLAAPALAAGSHAGGHDEMMAAGKPGEASDVDRTVAMTMSETDDGRMIFEPAGLEVRQGETIGFTITNAGEIDHEFVVDSHEKNMEHKVLMEKFPEMEHDDPNAIRLSEGGSGEIIWTFAVAGTFEFACLIPGHYESGMKGDIVVASK
ncbi:cupredoxin domain-containing protein [Hoeflea sp.]|uniref:cupredoxin domain-containing protein n=1 Tax=Hoeflea sp. TaxID=1940281 RepID=UPI003BAFB0EB